jgi:DNA-binding CsgD family transcriptional regulator
MSHSQRLSVEEMRTMYRLAREACELGSDPVVWRKHVLEKMTLMLGAPMGSCYVGRLPFDPLNAGFMLDVNAGLPRQWIEYFSSGDYTPDPTTPAIVSRLHVGFTATRPRLCSDEAWYHSGHFNNLFRPMHWDHTLVSIVALPEKGLFSGLGFPGILGQRAFSDRQRQMLQLLHEELLELWTHPPLTPTPEWRNRLSPRLSEILDALLQGLTEKQVARRLGLRPATVHNHVTRLYCVLEVNSRAELVAKAKPPPVFRPALLA